MSCSLNSKEPLEEGILPVCIRQLILFDGEVMLFNFAYKLVSLVAIVRKIDKKNPYKILYTFEDHTGQIDGIFWLNGEENNYDTSPILSVNRYSNIIASLRKIGGQNIIVINFAEEVFDINCVTTHRLETLFVRYKVEQASMRVMLQNVSIPPPVSLPSLVPSHLSSKSSSLPLLSPRVKIDSVYSTNAFHDLIGKKDPKILKIIEDNGDKNDGLGITRAELHAFLPKLGSNVYIENSLEYMIQVGVIYATIDSNHFKIVQ